MTNEKTKASEEQIAYANVLNIGMWFGLFLLIVTFFVYISGVIPSYVPIDDLPKYWTMRVHDFNTALNAPTGWGWVSLVGKGDYLNFIGIAILSGLTILCYLVITPILARKKDRAYVVIAIVEVLVLSLAASGLLKVGGH
jgi:putative copper export protein